MLKWIVNHNLMDVNCNRAGCGGISCQPIALGEDVALKCIDCGEKSKGAKRGFWAQGKLGFVKQMFVVFSISSGFSFKHVMDHIGFVMNKNTWTKYVKRLGLISAELLQRVRQDPSNKWMNAQFDETAFGTR